MLKKKNNFQKISILLKPQIIQELSNLLPNLVLWLSRRQKKVQFIDSEEERIKKIFKGNTAKDITFIPKDNIFSDSDLIIVLGGDGTLIGACRLANKQPTPIFGVNLGHLGFLTEFNKIHFFEELDTILAGNYQTKVLDLYRARVFNNKKVIFETHFINDAVISKYEIARMFNLSLESNGEHIYNISGDGLIISTPCGSTAYSLAAGGPIVHPDVKALLLTPICPHSLGHRPLVVTNKSSIKIRSLNKSHKVTLTLDGQTSTNLGFENYVEIIMDKNKKAHVIKNIKKNYFDTLREKFEHGYKART